ncbi:MBL fold metallo-hydrolase RNA specificity domain-containing protein [Marinobacterium mangrovicola]|uniref:Metallo-beta-lactamase family protein n=1 Tax=Marinobacterium mangrovicola TaxID=1476959 RepID=A0A4R1GFU9_9GAMM|nr:MBL fold metallo-hydrolase [Marinobacterium mangrovicola]TCK07124.1 metallo-beta-lactamase family protein [Marinobacterium mangrovicola]
MPYKEIQHHGAIDGVTGSCHQLHIDDNQSLLIDCGLFQGAETGSAQSADRQTINFDTDGIMALIVTHVHIDHVGRIPWLLAAGFRGPIICSQPSAKLLPLVLEDAFRLGISRERSQIENYLDDIESRIVALPYKQWFTLMDSAERQVRIRLQRAGHILGSAYVEVDCQRWLLPHRRSGAPQGHNTLAASTTDGSNIQQGDGHAALSQAFSRIVFSGDLGASHTPLLPAPRPPYKADILVLESTYGDRNHESRATRKYRLKAAIERAQENRGTVLIPAFSIGRTQELLYELEEMLGESELPVILDSPLASKFTAAYRELKPFWDEEAHARLKQGRKPLAFDTLLTVDSHDEHLKMVRHLAESGRPAIVIAGSGMCNAGRIINYLKAMLSDERHAVLFVGYQAEGTPGRDIQKYGPRKGYVELDGERYIIRAWVETIGGYSAHVDQRGLVGFVKGIKCGPRKIRLVHGDKEAKRTLKEALEPFCENILVGVRNLYN